MTKMMIEITAAKIGRLMKKLEIFMAVATIPVLSGGGTSLGDGREPIGWTYRPMRSVDAPPWRPSSVSHWLQDARAAGRLPQLRRPPGGPPGRRAIHPSS